MNKIFAETASFITRQSGWPITFLLAGLIITVCALTGLVFLFGHLAAHHTGGSLLIVLEDRWLSALQ